MTIPNNVLLNLLQVYKHILPVIYEVLGENRKALLVGLHTCGDLSTTILRSFVNFNSVQSVVLVGCCYHKLNNGKDKLFQQQWGKPVQVSIVA